MNTIYTIQVYYSELDDFDKEAILIEFTKSDIKSILESLKHHIIITTDTIGIGINNLDI